MSSMYTVLVPTKEEEDNYHVLKRRTRACGFILLFYELAITAYHVCRVMDTYQHTAHISDIRYGLFATAACLLILQISSFIFAAIYTFGAFREERSFFYLWLISACVLTTLKSVLIGFNLYSTSSLDNGSQHYWRDSEIAVFVLSIFLYIFPAIFAVYFTRKLGDRIATTFDERQILL